MGCVPIFSVPIFSVLPLDSIPSTESGKKEYFKGKFMDVELDHNNSMLLSASFSTDHESIPQEGIFVLPDGEVSDKGKLVYQEGLELPGGEETIEGFGLIDLSGKNGHYVVHPLKGPLSRDKRFLSEKVKSSLPSIHHLRMCVILLSHPLFLLCGCGFLLFYESRTIPHQSPIRIKADKIAALMIWPMPISPWHL